jgi:ABC-type sugar transport system ATPase subunit
MNLLPGWRATADGALSSPLGTAQVPRRLAQQVAAGQAVILGFRSDGARLLTEGDSAPDGQLTLDAEVLNAEPHYAQHMQVVNVQAAGRIFGVQAPMDVRLNTGWPIKVAIPQDTIYLFDEQSELRIKPAD